jgi:hypothetical protein
MLERPVHHPWHTEPRRAVGCQLIDGPKAAYAVAAAIAADTSNTGRLLRTLRDDDGAVADAGLDRDGKPTYALATGQEERLLASVRDEQPSGALLPGQDVLFVTVKDRQETIFAKVLRTGALTAESVWAARTDGFAQYILVFSKESNRLAAVMAAEALRAAGLRVRSLALHEVMSAEHFRRETAAMRLAGRARVVG